MSFIKTTGEKKLMLFSGRAHPELAESVSEELGIELTPTTAYDFANGEIYIRYQESVRGCDAFVIQSCTEPINTWVMEALIMVDALKRASAKRITVVVPFFPYSRQDKKGRGREPISARLMTDLFKVAGANRLMAVDLHTAQIQGFFDGPVDHLYALPLLATYVKRRVDRSRVTIVSPDAGRLRLAERWSETMGGAPLAFIHKTRDPDRPNEARANRVVGEVAGRVCILQDDMIDTGGTITKAADALFDAGALDVIIAATHAIFSGPAIDRLKNSRVSEVVVTDTLPLNDEHQFDRLTVLPIASLIARAVREVFDDGSVTSLFDGHA
jgi:ribose-phosphate pyrophosphokinase